MGSSGEYPSDRGSGSVLQLFKPYFVVQNGFSLDAVSQIDCAFNCFRTQVFGHGV